MTIENGGRGHLLAYLSCDTEKILHMFYDPRATPMCGVLHQVDAFSHQFPKPMSARLQKVSDGGKKSLMSTPIIFSY